MRVLEQPKIFLMGDGHELGTLRKSGQLKAEAGVNAAEIKGLIQSGQARSTKC